MSAPLPTFIIGGTQPAGTGQLYLILLQHPDIYLPLPMQPECGFFFKSREYEKGLDYYREKYFSASKGQKARGERTSLLISSEWVPARLKRDVPDIKLIFLFRNPVDRAWAHYRFTALAGFETLPFPEALEREDERARAETDPFWRELRIHSYFARGLYHGQLKRYLDLFSREQLLLLRSDELIDDFEGATRRIFEFLGVDPGFRAGRRQDFSSPFVLDLELQASLRKSHPKDFDRAIQRVRQGLPLETECDRAVRANVTFNKPAIPPELRRELTSRYRPHNERFASLVPFSIRDWL